MPALRAPWQKHSFVPACYIDNDGIFDRQDRCPKDAEVQNGFEDQDGCPDVIDKDKDGVFDDKDKCPEKPEDKDEFEDEDGCPETDNDQDGIEDAKDKCPLKPETKNGFEDEDGCPDKAKVVIKPEKKEIKKIIYFDFNKTKISPLSINNIEKLIKLLKTNKKLKVMLEGHSDNIGSKLVNIRISLRRTKAVRHYLLKKGIRRSRIRMKGFAFDKPIADNSTAGGRAKNRRVEFTVWE